MKTDQTTKVLLGVIATGVAALTALAFEKRYSAQLRPIEDDLDDATDHAYDRISRKTDQIARSAKNEAGRLRDRWEDGVDNFREKASHLKEKVADGVDRVGDQLREGAEKLRDGFKDATRDAKEGLEDAATEAKHALKDTKL